MIDESQISSKVSSEKQIQEPPRIDGDKKSILGAVKEYVTQKTSLMLDKMADLTRIDPIALSEEQAEMERLQRELFILDTGDTAKEVNGSPQEEVGKFITRVWEHPLLDDI